MNFDMIILNQSIETMQIYATWIQEALSFISKLRMFMKILQMMLKKDLINQIVKSIDHYLQGRNDKVIGLMKGVLGGKIITKFVALRPKTYSYLMDDDNSDKQAERTKKCVIKKILKFSDYENCLFKNETILKSQQRSKSEADHVYTEEINKIAISSNDDKRLHRNIS